ncbi:MAG: hypothetical protein ABI763_12195 [Bacteroidota bacterium]
MKRKLLLLSLLFFIASTPLIAQTDSIIIQSCINWLDGQQSGGNYTVDTFDINTGLLRSEVDSYYWINYSYNQNNKVDSVTTYRPSWIAESRMIHLYNLINKDSVVLDQNYVSTVWKDISQKLYDYDSLGRMLTEVDQRWDTTVWHTTNNTYYTYNGSLINYVLSVTVPPTDSTWKVYDYDTLGNYCITTVRYSFNLGIRDTLDGGTCFNYRDQITSYSDGNGTYYFYSYDSLGHLISSGGESPFQGAASWGTSYLYSCSGLLRETHYDYGTDQQWRSTDCDYYYIGTSQLYVAVEPNHTICFGDTVHFTSTAIVGNPPISYSWSPSSGLSSDTVPNPDAYPDSTTTYYLTATDSLGNSFISDCITITVKPIPDISISATDTTSICYGDTVHLTSTSSQNNLIYYWRRNGSSFYGSGIDSITFALETGNYFLQVRGTNGCSSVSNSIFVYSNTAAQGMVHWNTSQGCIGDTIEIITYPLVAPFHNYQWIMDSVIIPGATDSVFFATQTGWYQVVITSDTSACSYTTNPWYGYLTFSPPPTPDIFPAQDTIVCPYTYLELKTTYNPQWSYFYFVNGTSYQWWNWSPDSVQLSINSPTYLKIRASNNGCIAFTDSILVDVFPQINFNILATPVPPYCMGDSVLLTTSIPSNGTYQWTNGDTDSIAYADTTRYYGVSIIDTNGCNAYANISMTFNPSPPIATISQFGATLSPSSSASSFQWYLNDTIIPGATFYQYVPTQAGFYTVELINSFGCSTLSYPFYFSPVGINSLSGMQQGIYVYPTIATTSFNIYCRPQTKNEKLLFKIYNVEGEKISESEIGKSVNEFQRRNLKPGIYFWRVLSTSANAEIIGIGKIIFVD